MLQYFIFSVYCLLKVSGGPLEDDYSLRVTDTYSLSNSSGWLEIKLLGHWRNVCGAISEKAARVVCRQLGYQSLYARAYTRKVEPSNTFPYLPLSVRCKGNEENISKCSFESSDLTSCRYRARISCPPESDLKARLVGGGTHDGRLEVKVGQLWRTVCDKNFNVRDARVVCRQLGFFSYGIVVAVSNRWKYGRADWTTPIWLDDRMCWGTESSLMHCPHNALVSTNCDHHDDVAVVCGNATDIRLRLSGTSSRTLGRVEISVDGEWGTVCDDRFNNNAAMVACRELGLPYSLARTISVSNIPRFSGQIWLDEVRCVGNETSLMNCQHNELGVNDCTHREDVGIHCFDSTADIRFRLSGTTSRTLGRVEISVGGEWGTVCDDGFNNNAAKVVCRELGLPYSLARTISLSNIPRFSGQIWLDNVYCVGNETSLINCQHNELVVNDCTHSDDVMVHCLDSTSPVDIRLSGGFDTVSGRLEISIGGEWGTVCNDYFDSSAARVVCRQLGLPHLGARTISSSQFETGTGTIWLDNVRCTGTEDSLFSCRHNDLGVSDCSHSQDVAVRCTDTTDASDYSVRLRGGKDERSGFVEVFINGEWGTVCDDSFTNQAAKVVCRQLGYSDANAVVEYRTNYYSGNKRILLDDVACYGYESSLEHCTHEPVGQDNCDESEAVAVSCKIPVNVAAIAGGISGSFVGVVIICLIIRHLKQKASEPSLRASTRTRGNVEQSLHYTVSLQYNTTSGTIQTRGTDSNGVIVPPTSPGLFSPPPSYENLFPTAPSIGENPLRVPSVNPSTVGSSPTAINSPPVVTPTVAYN